MTEQEMRQRETEIQRANAFSAYNHIEMTDVKQDYAEVRLELVPESMNFRGTVHGGAYFTMADMCAGIVCRTDGRSYATQHASVEYLCAAAGGVLTGRGNVIHRGRTSCVVDVRITEEDGRPVFIGTFQFACIGEKTEKP